MKSRDANEKTRKQASQRENLSHILLYVFSLHFLKIHHDYFFRRVFQSVWARFLSGNKAERSVASEAATLRCSSEKVFWKYAANLQKNTHAEVRFQ